MRATNPEQVLSSVIVTIYFPLPLPQLHLSLIPPCHHDPLPPYPCHHIPATISPHHHITSSPYHSITFVTSLPHPCLHLTLSSSLSSPCPCPCPCPCLVLVLIFFLTSVFPFLDTAFVPLGSPFSLDFYLYPHVLSVSSLSSPSSFLTPSFLF